MKKYANFAAGGFNLDGATDGRATDKNLQAHEADVSG